jgi:hypothetical protein
MSDTTTTTHTTADAQGSSCPAEGTGTPTSGEPQLLTADAVQQEQAHEAELRRQAEQEAARAEEQERQAKAAAKTLAACVTAYRAGERGYRDHLLKAGRLAAQYVEQRRAMGHPRGNAVKAVEGELCQYASRPVRVDELIRAYQSWRLLCEARGQEKAADRMSYGHYAESWAQLLCRTQEPGGAETWSLLPGMEADCCKAFDHVAANGIATEGARQQVRALIAQHTERQAAAAKAKAEADAVAAKAAKAEADRAAAESLAACQAAAEADRKAAAAKEAGAAADELARLQADQAAAKEAAAKAAAEKAAAEEREAGAEKARIRAQQEAEQRAKVAQNHAEQQARRAQAEVTKAAAKAGSKSPAAQTRGPAKADGPLALDEKPALAEAQLVALVAGYRQPEQLLYALGRAPEIAASQLAAVALGMGAAGRVEDLQHLAQECLREAFIIHTTARLTKAGQAWAGKDLQQCRPLAVAMWDESRAKQVAGVARASVKAGERKAG